MSKSFDHMLLSHLPKLRNYALRLTRNAPDADDLVQATALLVLKAESQFAVGSSFKAWSYRIMKNSFLGGCRSNKGPTICIDDVGPEFLSSHDRADDRVFAHEVMRAVDKLPPKLRHALTMICAGELSYDEASAALSCTIGTVKSRLWRARRQLEQRLMAVSEVSGFTNTSRSSLANA